MNRLPSGHFGSRRVGHLPRFDHSAFLCLAPSREGEVCYDWLGREVRVFDLTAPAPGGQTDIVWSSTDQGGMTVNSGVYFVVYRTAAGVQTLKLMMLK